MKRLIAPILFLAFAALLVIGCKKLDDPLPIDRLASILLGKDTLNMYVGEKRSVPVAISPSNYSLDSIRWKSLDTNILSISKIGLVTGKKPGTTTVSVSNLTNSISLNLKITVKDSIEMGLIAYYPFHNSGKDSSGRMNDVTYYSNVTATTDRFGKANSAFSFNGVSSYMVVPDRPELRLNNTNFTLNTWVKLNDYNSSFGNNVLSKHFTGNDNGWAWGVSGLQTITKVGIITFGPGGTSVTERGEKIVDLGQWHMITSTYNYIQREFTIYVDGQLDVVIRNNFPSPNANISANMYIGRDDPSASASGYFVNGSIDDIRIYNRLLTPTQVKRLFTHKN